MSSYVLSLGDNVVVFEEIEKGIKDVAKYIADRVKEQHSLYLGLLISLTAGVIVSKVIDMVPEGFKIAGLTTLIFASLALFIIIATIIDYAANITLILKFETPTSMGINWRDIVGNILNLKGTRLSRNARLYNFYLKEPCRTSYSRAREEFIECKHRYNGPIPLTLRYCAFKLDPEEVVIVTVTASGRLFTTLIACITDLTKSAWLRLKVKLGREKGPLVGIDPWYELFEDLLLFLDDLVKDFKKHHVRLVETAP